MSTTPLSFHNVPHPPADNCSICRVLLIDGNPVRAHDGHDGPKHPMHLACLQQYAGNAGILLLGNITKCPVCREVVNSDSLFSLTERVVRAAKALASGKYNLMNDPAIQMATLIGASGILFGAADALGAGTGVQAAGGVIGIVPTFAAAHVFRAIDKFTQGSLGGRAASAAGAIAIAAAALFAELEHPTAVGCGVFVGALGGLVVSIMDWDAQWSAEAAITQARELVVRFAEMRSRLENGIYSAQTCSGHHEAVSSIRTNFFDTEFFSASADNTIKVWDSKTGKWLRTLVGHTDKITAIIPLGDELVSASWDGTIRRWNEATGLCTSVSESYTGPIDNLAVAPGGFCFGDRNGKVVFLPRNSNTFVEPSQIAEGVGITSIFLIIHDAAEPQRIRMIRLSSDMYLFQKCSSALSKFERRVASQGSSSKKRMIRSFPGILSIAALS